MGAIVEKRVLLVVRNNNWSLYVYLLTLSFGYCLIKVLSRAELVKRLS